MKANFGSYSQTGLHQISLAMKVKVEHDSEDFLKKYVFI